MSSAGMKAINQAQVHELVHDLTNPDKVSFEMTGIKQIHDQPNIGRYCLFENNTAS